METKDAIFYNPPRIFYPNQRYDSTSIDYRVCRNSSLLYTSSGNHTHQPIITTNLANLVENHINNFICSTSTQDFRELIISNQVKAQDLSELQNKTYVAKPGLKTPLIVVFKTPHNGTRSRELSSNIVQRNKLCTPCAQ